MGGQRSEGWSAGKGAESMTLEEVLALVAGRLGGKVATESDVRDLRAGLTPLSLPEWLVHVLRAYRLAGSRMSIDERADESGIGVQMLWLTSRQMISEAHDAEPGMTVCPLGFVPIGACASGSGDPYFLDLRDPNSTDPAVIRIRHDLAGRGEYPVEGFERVAPALSTFLRRVFAV